MMLLPALLLPLVLCLAVYRLVQWPRRLCSGALRLTPHQPALWGSLAVAAYGLLGACTVWVIWAVAQVAVAPDADRLSAWLQVAGLVAAYPLVYLLTAWVFFHALPQGAAGRGR
ncbi:hypothetical protein [Ideonella livida]|uniref:Uncharacterized protein n=1 Tax=Ideonella livida TaxID=2707176 RepID=A0A7C9PJT8_9BURK|nr:hypothetical protein [Ideonella livida]NDY93817.1 hypothetical protein [Ideonella livida]